MELTTQKTKDLKPYPIQMDWPLRLKGFYRDLFPNGDLQSGFQFTPNQTFNHPVVNPNFLRTWSPAHLRQSQVYFRLYGIDSHWVNLFAEETSSVELPGYSKELVCVFNLFEKPYQSGKKLPANFLIREWQQLPSKLRQAYYDGTAANSVNLPIDTQLQINRVLRSSKGAVSHFLVTADDGQLAAAATIVRLGEAAMVVQAWVDSSRRRLGLAATLFEQMSRSHFAEGGRWMFYWTLNPHISQIGEKQLTSLVYRRSLKA